MADVQIAVIDQQTTQLSVIDQENTQLALAAPDETQVSIAVPGVQGPKGEGVPLGGSANQVLFKQSGTNYDTAWGNVTSAMIGDLQIVDADVATAAAIAGTKISPNFGSQTVQTTGVISHALGTAGAPTVTFTGDTNTGIYSPGADQLAISTGGQGRLFVDASGNIGIGTGSPVNSANYSSLTLQGATGGQIALRAGSTLKSYFFNDASKTTIGAVDDFVIATTGSITERLRITSAGQTQFNSLGTAAAPILSFTADTNTGIYSPGADQLAISTGGTGRLFVRSGGLVEINPSATEGNDRRLLVRGSAAGDGAILLKSSSTPDGTSRGFLLQSFSTSSDAYVWQQENSPLIFGTNATERLRITSAGLVGIGTSTPDVRTHIVGTALTKSWSADSNDFLAVENSSTSAIDIRSGSAAGGNVFFSDGDARSRGRIEYSHVADELRFGTAGTNSRVVIDSSGRLLVGTSAAPNLSTVASPRFPKSTIFNTAGNDERQSLGLYTGNTGTSGPILVFTKNKATSTTSTLVASGDETGSIAFSACDGSGVISAASIAGFVDGTPGANDMPGRLVFSTTADGAASPTERLRIDSSGRLLVGTSSDSGGALLQVSGDRIRVGTAKTPASATATGTAGEICWDASYIYVCTATNTWKRTAIATW